MPVLCIYALMNRRWIKLGAFIALLTIMGLLITIFWDERRPLSPQRVGDLVRSFGIWAPLVYLVAYGQPLVPLPASLMTIVGGIAFGKSWGFVAALFGATLRACSEFLVAKLLGRDVVARLLKGRVAKLDAKIGTNGFKAVLLIRLIPNFPFDIQNYALGFSKVRFLPYALGTFLGMAPGCFAFVYLGYSLTEPKQIWKLGVAVLLIIGLMITQRVWQGRQPKGIIAKE